MRAYSVEFFDDRFTYRLSTNVDDTDVIYSEDYLDPEQNAIDVIAPIDAQLNDYIRIVGNGNEIWGIVTKIDEGNKEEKNTVKITYKDIMELMDIDTVVDTSQIGTGTLEDYIASQISAIFINGDDKQAIYGLSVDVRSETSDWTLDLTSDDSKDMVANLFDDIILPAFKKYGIKVEFDISIKTESIVAIISINSESTHVIESDLPNVLSKDIKYKKIKKEINKLSVYNKADFSFNRTYYLHTDGTYDTTDIDRVTPVVFSLETVKTKTPSEWEEKFEKTLNSAVSTVKSCQSKLAKGETLDEATLEKESIAVTNLNTVPGISLTMSSTTGAVSGFDEDTCKTQIGIYVLSSDYQTRCYNFASSEFIDKADEQAEKKFASNKYENNIEIECLRDDPLIRPLELKIGQVTEVISNCNVYETILTGRKISDTVTLIFGNVRVELTKILKGRN